MAISSSDILNLSHALKDICEVNCKTPECLSQTLKILLQYNLIQANLQFMLNNENTCRLKGITSEHNEIVERKAANKYAREYNQTLQADLPTARPASAVFSHKPPEPK